MEEQNQLTQEIKKLNQQLERLTTSGKHMIYSANPFKFSLFNFLAGIFHTLGSLFGYIVIFGLSVYFFSRMNLTGVISNWMEKTLKGVDWNRIMPATQIPGNLDLNDVNPGGQLEKK